MGSRPDYSGMWTPDGKHFPPRVGGVVHKTRLQLDEKGTRAAAATAVEMFTTGCLPSEPTYFRADRPFVLVIYDEARRNVLFTGVVMDPGTPGERPELVED